MKFLLLSSVLLFFSGCSHLHAHVDSFGNEQLSKTTPHFFSTEGQALAEQQITEACSDGAMASGLNVVKTQCADCRIVSVKGRLGPPEQVVSSSGTSMGMGYYGSNFGTGFGFPLSVQSHQEVGKEIQISIFGSASDKTTEKKELKAITARSIDSSNSLAGVAYEMCKMAFEEYPANLRGKEYSEKYHH